MAWKYVVVRAGNQEIPLIFPGHLVHASMSELLRDYLVDVAAAVMPPSLHLASTFEKLREQVQPVAAGEITFDIGACTGGSETLGLKARPEDARLIGGYNYNHGYVEDSDGKDG